MPAACTIGAGEDGIATGKSAPIQGCIFRDGGVRSEGLAWYTDMGHIEDLNCLAAADFCGFWGTLNVAERGGFEPPVPR